MKILIIGYGAIGHSIASKIPSNVQIDILTSDIFNSRKITNNFGETNKINQVYHYGSNIDEEYDYAFFTLPLQYKISRSEELSQILKPTKIIITPANQGTYSILPKSIKDKHEFVLLERVPYISRVNVLQESVNIYGIKPFMHYSATYNLDNKLQDDLKYLMPGINEWIPHSSPFDIELISSNATLHTARIYNLFKDGNNFDKDIRFYVDWDDETSELFMNLELEVLKIKDAIEKKDNITIDLFDMFTYFNVKDITIANVKKGVTTFPPFQSINFYAKDKEDLKISRFLVDDCILGIDVYLELASKYNVDTPNFKMINDWAKDFVK